MPSPATTDLPQPKSWDEFEDIIADILAERWRTPHVTRNGRNGQGQHGVDVYALGAHVNQRYVGAQCRNVKKLKAATVDEIVADAEAFQPPLAELLIATTLSRDAAIQQHERSLNSQRVASGKFPVHVLFWEDISLALSGSPQLLAKYFPGWAGIAATEIEPRFDVKWIVDGEHTDAVTVPSLSAYVRDLLWQLDPYTDEELEYLTATDPADAAKAVEFNKAVNALYADEAFQARWRTHHAESAMYEGTRCGLVIGVEGAAAADILVDIDFDNSIDVFEADARPRSDDELELPEHPKLKSETRYARVTYDTDSLQYKLFGVGELYPEIRLATRSRGLWAEGQSVTIRIARSAPRREHEFEGDFGIVVAPWCPEGTFTVRWRADAENLKHPQTGELKLVVTPTPYPVERRRRSYIGPPIVGIEL